ncbi:uncharacterized protein LOC124622889 [Schistocerca americana]|uniref:uncharacterized protein LOC124622889 n=1 Tax=Schistocerca americana TaxID=7009 RepID=UPI001F50287F|nr:uncharacterized protein LOC124622889 [Schistocerca americana]
MSTGGETSNTKTIINLTERALDEPTISVLSKGLKFALTPRMLPKRDTISNVEQAIRILPLRAAEEARGETSRVLEKTTMPKNNIMAEEHKAQLNLHSDKGIVVLAADKGNVTVLLKSEDYWQKIDFLLPDPAYKEVGKDTTASVMHKTINLLNSSVLDRNTIRKLYPRAPAPP